MAGELRRVPEAVLQATQNHPFNEHSQFIKKISWIVDEIPKIKLEFEPYKKNFILEFIHCHDENNIEKIFGNVSDTATTTTWRVTITNQNERGQIDCFAMMHELSEKYKKLWKETPEECEVHFRKIDNVEISKWSLWNMILEFTLVDFDKEKNFVLTPNVIVFLLGRRRIRKLEMLNVQCSGELDPMRAVYIQHERVELKLNKIPFQYFERMSSVNVKVETDSLKPEDLKKLIQSWMASRRIGPLQKLFILLNNPTVMLDYSSILGGIVHQSAIPDGCYVKRKSDNMAARIYITKNTFSFMVRTGAIHQAFAL